MPRKSSAFRMLTAPSSAAQASRPRTFWRSSGPRLGIERGSSVANPKFAIVWATLRANFGFKATLVSWFRSSHHLDIGLRANFETETTLGINTLLVSFDTEIPQEHDIEMVRISESEHQQSTESRFEVPRRECHEDLRNFKSTTLGEALWAGHHR